MASISRRFLYQYITQVLEQSGIGFTDCNGTAVNGGPASGGGSNDGGPYTVAYDTPAVGQVTVTDTTSLASFVIDLTKAPEIGDADGDSGINTIEGGGANGGDLMNFTVDGVTVGSVEILTGGLTKWTLDGIVDPLVFAYSPVTTATRDALTAAEGYTIYNTDTNVLQYYDGSAWQNVGTSVDLNTTISNETGANGTGLTVPTTAPAGTPDIGDLHIEVYDDVTLYFTATAADWTTPAVVEVARDLTSFADATTASDDAAGSGGVATTAARSDHKHAAQAPSGDGANRITTGADGLHYLADINATETTTGFVELATPAETQAGTDDSRAVHPLGLKSALNLKQDVTITDTDSDNPLGHVIKQVAGARQLSHPDSFKVVPLIAAPVDGTTVAYYVGQLFWDYTNKKLYEATAKSTDPDTAGTGSTFVEVALDSGVKNNFNTSSQPTATDDDAAGYERGSLWYEDARRVLYICQDASTGAAEWVVVNDYVDPITTVNGDLTPDYTLGTLFELEVDAGGANAYTINAPVLASLRSGQEISIVLWNNQGAATTFTFDGIYRRVTDTDDSVSSIGAITLAHQREHKFTFVYGIETGIGGVWKLKSNTYFGSSTAVADVAYTETFDATTSWGTAAGGFYTITVTQATHGKAATGVIEVALQEDDGVKWVNTEADEVAVNKTTGDVTFSVAESLDGRFAGRVIIRQD